MRRFAAVRFVGAAFVLAACALSAWLLLPPAGARGSAAAAPAARSGWSAAGTLLEACTCAVPCTCNFGEGPSPHPYCYAVYTYKLDKAAWNGTDLSGLVFGGADGPKGLIGFLDERATPAQRPALEQIARQVFAKGGPNRGPRPFVPARITHSVAGNDLRLDVPGRGGFTARVLLGGDGKTPIVVENNTVWPIRRAIKGKTRSLAFKDERTGAIRGDGTNANYGAFAFTGAGAAATAAAARPAAAAVVAARPHASSGGSSCCGSEHRRP